MFIVNSAGVAVPANIAKDERTIQKDVVLWEALNFYTNN